MGRNKSTQRSQFVDTNVPCNGTQTYHHCSYCIRAKEMDASVEIENVIGSVHGFQTHLNLCQYAPPPELKVKKAPKRLWFSGYNRTSPCKTPSPYRQMRSPYSRESKKERNSLEPNQGFRPTEEGIKKFYNLLVEFQADNTLPDTFIERDSTIRLLEFLNPYIKSSLPSRRVLGGKLLNIIATKAEAEEKKALQHTQKYTKGRVNFVSDVWMNQSKNHLLGCQLALYGKMANIGLLTTSKRHDGLALAQLMETVINKALNDKWDVGAVITDDAGQCSRARRILALRWPRIVFVKCFAHDINNLVKAVLKIPAFYKVAEQAANIVTSINLSSSKWLVATREVMIQTYGFQRSLIALCSTRWNSMQGCFASLLRMKTAMKILSTKYSEDKDFPSIMRELESLEFWSALQQAETVIRPLCLASYKLQENENTLGDVVVCYRNLLEHFRASIHKDALLPLIEQRWRSCEQPLFMLAYYLHPTFISDARKLPVTNISGFTSLYKIAMYYYEKLIGKCVGPLRGYLYDWFAGSYCDAALSDFSGSSQHPIPSFWNCLKTEKPNSILPHLAIIILSVNANTATCERYFSELALIHTARRNRMSSEKSRQIAIVRKYVRDRDNQKATTKIKIPPPKRIVCSTELQTLSATVTPARSRKAGSENSAYTTSMSNEITPVELGVTTRSSLADIDDDDPGESGSVEIMDAVFNDWNNETDIIVSSEVEPECDDADNQVEQIHSPKLYPFPENNDLNFPQEVISPLSLRSQTATLAELFGFER